MKKLILFLSFIMLMFSTNTMAFSDFSHKDTQKIKVSKEVPILVQVVTVNVETITINQNFDVGWITADIYVLNTISNPKDIFESPGLILEKPKDIFESPGLILEKPKVTDNTYFNNHINKLDNYSYRLQYYNYFKKITRKRYTNNTFSC